jgi:RimJ/RimL family protein N-acetyltransferase
MPKITHPEKIKGTSVLLRKIKLSDTTTIFKKFHRPEILKWMLFQPPKGFKIKDQEDWIKKIIAKSKKHGIYIFGITIPGNNEVIGIISIDKINWKNLSGQIGYWLAKEHWGKGIIPEAVKMILTFAFKKIKLHRVYGAVFEKNLKSRRVLEKCGFSHEGITRESEFRYNRWHNKIRYGILSHEFKKIK